MGHRAHITKVTEVSDEAEIPTQAVSQKQATVMHDGPGPHGAVALENGPEQINN